MITIRTDMIVDVLLRRLSLLPPLLLSLLPCLM